MSPCRNALRKAVLFLCLLLPTPEYDLGFCETLPVNLAPTDALAPVILPGGSPIFPQERIVTFPISGDLAAIRPSLTVPAEDMGQTVTTVLLLDLYSADAQAYWAGEQTLSADVLTLDPLQASFPLSALQGISLDAYYGYVLSDGTLRYQAYRIVLTRAIEDIAYVPDNPHVRHKLDIYTPEGVPHETSVVFIPGGAWRQGDKSLYTELGRTLAAFYGYTVAVINYRLSNSEDGQAVHPDHITDAAKAVAWVKANIAQYGGSPDYLYLFGQSAGAHLASLLATDGQYLQSEGCSIDDIRAVVSMSGAYDLYDLVKYPLNPLDLSADDVVMYKKMMQDAFGGWDQTVLDSASPEKLIFASQPPFLVITAEDDMPGFEAEGENFFDVVRALELAADAEYVKLLRSDFSDVTWNTAADMAATEPLIQDYVGHYAEVVSINTREYDSPAALVVTGFIDSH